MRQFLMITGILAILLIIFDTWQRFGGWKNGK